ncbi:ATP phosphoribosyltransferase [Rhizoclosmatium globosum]|uniref:ATP phosphoribosyltransferase n=1 Tax=Rhizoclosmatium globosum TaxID=329046 RepID=A0A1Y2CLC7_9FUNG|nr:ATP phosphoribosyltransferase [Rhizoclosmatium globosum]|eukprot:ORY47803.1 ATP phosphoribosyltransferase [Rhizoclosmatium globosum]
MEFVDLQDRLLFGIPKKGRLNEQVMTLLQGADIQFHRKNRIDIALSTNHPIALVFLPAADIAQFVANGNVDIGITGQDMVAEAGANVEELLALGFGKCKLCVQAPVDSPYKSAKDLVGKRIATSFSSLVGKVFQELDAEAAKAAGLKQVENPTLVQFLSGSVEASCALGLADAIVDLVESGETMHAAKLHAIETILTTEAVLICNPNKHKTNPLIEKIKRRIEGVIVAQRYVLCTYNVPRSQMAEAVKITPGKKAPTISALETDGWVAVSVMVLKSKAADVMDALEEIGAQDILVTEIKNARMG